MPNDLTLLAAVGLGILHSMEPGHGKGVMSAYLLSTRAKALQACFLGLITALSHALSIFLLAGIASLTVHHVTPTEWVHGIEALSGFFILIIGVLRLIQSVKPHIVTVGSWSGKTGSIISAAHSTEGESHDHHDHDHEHHHHFHYHPKKAPTRLSQFFLVGFLTGIIPCPSALAIILAAVSSHQVMVGIQLVAAFSLGGALTMASLGYIMSRTSGKIRAINEGFIKLLSIGSALLIIGLGAAVTIRASIHIWLSM
ncbi:sulfite exporter TauE/SafE family protein [Pullulanibacillus sp. KACC 23026]|uniref:urease accessory protein UreH domain-containing protein n=1 Tax=Pullulanibacillus sp. KACC 23026 TaxID=3028315 RepID=UPI0023B07131|nr:sulfite exporter TauE/SafE family protein [Pullulanibacillus sp. KACC 23026]WEG13062.1 sulfite exporter TauE/SafE family protein [Pullulanibacillus sp. KACC 23026]